jgi:hypothetical protein
MEFWRLGGSLTSHHWKLGHYQAHTYVSFPVFVNAFLFFFCAVEMERAVLTEQRTNIKFLVKLGKSGREILEMLETVYGESAMKRRTVYKCVDRFKEGWESIDDNA